MPTRFCSSSECVNGGARHIDTALPITAKLFASFVGARTNDRSEIHSARISGDERLGKHDEACALAGSFSSKGIDLFQRALAVETLPGMLAQRQL